MGILKMQQTKHVVFVETNSSGIIGVETALNLGYQVSFIYSEKNKSLYSFDKMESLFPRLAGVVVCEDTLDCVALFTSVAALNLKFKIDSLITVLEYCVESTASSAEKLGVPGSYGLVAARARNKGQVRQVLKDFGLHSCKSFEATNLDSLLLGLEGFTYPVVTKPSRGAASFFVKVCNSKQDVVSAWKDFSESKSGTVGNLQSVISESLLVEEYLSGKMISAEVGLSQNEFRLFTIGERKRAKHNEVIELGTTMPAPLSVLEWSQVEIYAEGVVRALELGNGLFHLEIMVTSAGPVLIEVNPRLMGGSLPKVYNFAYKTNIYERLIEAHLGISFGLNVAKPSESVTSRIFGSIEDTQLAPAFDLEWVNDYADYDLQFDLYCKPLSQASYLNSNHDYLGALRLRAKDAANSRAVADEVIERFEICLGTKLAK
jgi:biotin carboxylase